MLHFGKKGSDFICYSGYREFFQVEVEIRNSLWGNDIKKREEEGVFWYRRGWLKDDV